MDHCLLVVIVAPSMENAMVDWLLDREDVSGFTSVPVYGHGASAKSMTPAEQVAGRQRRVMFQLHLAQETAAVIIPAAPGAGNRSRHHRRTECRIRWQWHALLAGAGTGIGSSVLNHR